MYPVKVEVHLASAEINLLLVEMAPRDVESHLKLAWSSFEWQHLVHYLDELLTFYKNGKSLVFVANKVTMMKETVQDQSL